ncbi:MAG TPA: M23 family metallopeptidase [Tepidiformaceae bacterium]|nr:M23 family metallopeptidase [Tepidiformaceae bacterium]
MGRVVPHELPAHVLNRRSFLTVLSGGMVVAASRRLPLGDTVGRALERTATGPAAPGSFRVVIPGLGQDGFPPEVTVSELHAYQGGAVMVTATRASAGTASVLGRQYQLGEGAGGLAGMVGFGVVDPPGTTRLDVNLVDDLGQTANFSYDFTVLATDWTFEEIDIPPPPPPDPNAPPPPPPLPDEQPRLNAIYMGVTPRRWKPNWVIPIALGGDIFISSYMGEERSYNGGPRGGHHGGTDIGAPAGTPIHATNDGIVVMAEMVLNRGNCTVLDHGAGVFSCYGHQSQFNVKVGDVVSQNDVIGLVGSTGLATGPHLHWEMAAGGVVVDGLRWLDGSQGFY